MELAQSNAGSSEIAQSITRNPMVLFLGEPLSEKNRAEALHVYLSPLPLTQQGS
jgi:hypothetical protein